MFNFLSFLMSLLHSIPFRHAIHFFAASLKFGLKVKGRTYAEAVREYGSEEDIWAHEAGENA